MLEKLVEILADKFVQPRSRKQKADDEMKEKLVFLHESLVNCHTAYVRYASDGYEVNLENWRKRVRELGYVLDDVSLALASFAPETFDRAAEYFYPEAPAPPDYTPRDDETRELIRISERLKMLQRTVPTKRSGNDFKEATSKLREFLGQQMSAGEILKAQEAYRRQTYWDQSI